MARKRKPTRYSIDGAGSYSFRELTAKGDAETVTIGDDMSAADRRALRKLTCGEVFNFDLGAGGIYRIRRKC